MIRCTTCRREHPMGVWAPGDRVLYRGPSRADGVHPGMRGTVVAYIVHAGARHQEVVVRTKRGHEVRCAPCELVHAGQVDAPATAPSYQSLTREAFRARLRERRVTLRIVAPPPA